MVSLTGWRPSLLVNQDSSPKTWTSTPHLAAGLHAFLQRVQLVAGTLQLNAAPPVLELGDRPQLKK